MTDITHIDDYRPHIQSVDPVTGNAVVMPVSLIEDMAAGKLPLVDEMSLRALLYMLTEKIEAGL